jgi:hypothetical protein
VEHGSDIQLRLTFWFNADMEGDFLCEEIISIHTFMNKIKNPTTLNILKLKKK